MKKNQKKTFTAYIDESLYQQVKEEAEAERRSFVGQLAFILENHFKQKDKINGTDNKN